MSKRTPTTADIPTAVYGCWLLPLRGGRDAIRADMLIWHDGGHGRYLSCPGSTVTSAGTTTADLDDVERDGPQSCRAWF